MTRTPASAASPPIQLRFLEGSVEDDEMERYLAQCVKEMSEAEGDDEAASKENSEGDSNRGY